jgi:hypothetical protein
MFAMPAEDKKESIREGDDLCHKGTDELRDSFPTFEIKLCAIRRSKTATDGTFDGKYMWLRTDSIPNLKSLCAKENIVALVKITKEKCEVS